MNRTLNDKMATGKLIKATFAKWKLKITLIKDIVKTISGLV